MAIQLTYQTPFGLAMPNGYVRIKTIEGDKNLITLNVEIFANKEFRDALGPSVSMGEFSFVPELEGDNFIKQGYEYLMTIEPFNSGTKI